jgi:hypothetical protein
VSGATPTPTCGARVSWPSHPWTLPQHLIIQGQGPWMSFIMDSGFSCSIPGDLQAPEAAHLHPHAHPIQLST